MKTLSRSLRYFEHVARTKSVRAASLELHIAPSAVSRAVQQLEYELGVPLFERTVRGLHLTAAGEMVLSYAQRWERESEQLAEGLRSLSGLQRQVIRIASVEAPSYDLIPQAAAEMRKRIQGLQLHLMVADTSTVLESVINGTVEIGVVINLSETAPVKRIWTVHNPVGVVVPPTHRLAGRKTITLADCIEEPFILPEEGLVARSAINAALGSAGPYQTVAISNRIVALKSLLRKGLGISFLTWLDVATEVTTGELKFIELEGNLIEHPYVSIVIARSTKPLAALELFIEMLRNAMPNGQYST
jgi:DNA-binding transcriptional LysR family regulator